MASLGLRQCCISAPPRPGPGSGVPPLPLQLIRHALGPLSTGCSAESCLAPLAVYNDTAALCKERLGSEQMAHAAEQAASAAAELLLDLLSHAVRPPTTHRARSCSELAAKLPHLLTPRKHLRPATFRVGASCLPVSLNMLQWCCTAGVQPCQADGRGFTARPGQGRQECRRGNPARSFPGAATAEGCAAAGWRHQPACRAGAQTAALAGF